MGDEVGRKVDSVVFTELELARSRSESVNFVDSDSNSDSGKTTDSTDSERLKRQIDNLDDRVKVGSRSRKGSSCCRKNANGLS